MSMMAQNEYQIPADMPVNNGELDWLIFNDKIGEVELSKKELVLCSKNKSYVYSHYLPKVAMTYSKVPLNMKGDFYLSVTLKPSKIDNETMFGLAFNVPNETDYNAIAFDDQFCYFLRVMNVNGVNIIQGKESRVRYKYTKKDKDMWQISLERRNGGDYVISLNGVEVHTIPGTTEFLFPAIGVLADNKCEVKVTKVSYVQWAAAPDVEN